MRSRIVIVILWFVLLAVILLAGEFQWIPYKVYEFGFVGWVGLTLIFGYTTLMVWAADDKVMRHLRGQKQPHIEYPKAQRRFCWKTFKMVEDSQ